MSSNIIFFVLVSIITNIRAQNVDCTVPRPGSTCILECGGIDLCKQKTLICRAYDPCIINCDATATCSAGTTINAYTATDVTVLCSGDNACKDGIVIHCGTGHCELHCSAQFSTSCENFGHIDTAYSASFDCIGDCPDNVPAPFSPSPTISPTTSPSNNPTLPTISPTDNPTAPPTTDPTSDPTVEPTYNPTYYPTIEPTLAEEKANYLTMNALTITVMTIFALCCVGVCLLRLLYLENKRRKRVKPVCEEDKNANTEDISSNILIIKKQEKKENESTCSENKESEEWKIEIKSAGIQFKISNAAGLEYNGSMATQSQSTLSNGLQYNKMDIVNMDIQPPPVPQLVVVSATNLVGMSSSDEMDNDVNNGQLSPDERDGLIVGNNDDEVENSLSKNV